MQGHRSLIGSLPEALDFDHGSTSGNAFIDPTICWNSVPTPAENCLAGFILSPSHMNNASVNTVGQERQSAGEWNLGEPSSSTIAYAGAGPTLEERRYGPTSVPLVNSVSVNPQFVQSSNSDGMPQNVNLNAAPVTHGMDNCQVMEASGNHNSSGTGCEGTSSSSGSYALLLPSGSGGYSVEQHHDRPSCSLDGRPCKRKAVEGNAGQSSVGASSSLFQRSEHNAWPAVSAYCDAGSSSSIAAQSELVNAGFGLGARGLGSDVFGLGPRRLGSDGFGLGAIGLNSGDNSNLEMARRAESSHRNIRLRVNPPNEGSIPPALFSSRTVARRSVIPSSHHSSRIIPTDHSLNLRSSTAVDVTASVSQPALLPVPALVQNPQPFRWNEIHSSRGGGSSGSITLCDTDVSNSRSTRRNMLEHSVIVPATELRVSARNPATAHLNGGNINAPGNVSSTSQTISNIAVHPLPAPTWIPCPSPPPRNSRRLAEYVRRSLFSLPAGEAGAQSTSHSPMPPNHTSSVDMTHSSNSRGHHRSHARSTWLERQDDNGVGIPYPLRNLGSTREGRNRLVVSEIRNVLDVIRRGENLRIEDFMFLDQSVFFGVADVHDRHRDMRLDVDNMSYEELLALEERIGNVNTGLSEETILKQLKQRKHSVVEGVAEAETEPCCICQEEYNEGEDRGKLDCGHDFHTECVKQWLMLKNWCPICKTTGLAT
ncbi:hypothetical protein K2173_026148 [Erythroxylum novogranatense]|uniref:RING-type E3 ubiquitin transferase n=1 Tax=Erythroxylum novogranatense TaxID=1862640 RepID=A0AAV8T9B5_9ROSI|nr:hypothetical protein K2173_026148 [Erythroxylum novogranatense]